MDFISHNPRTGKDFAKLQGVDSQQAIQLVHNAHKAFLNWRKVEVNQRAEAIRNFAKVLDSMKEQIAESISAEMGKPTFEALGELQKSVSLCHYYAENGAKFLSGKRGPEEAGPSRIEFEPLGVILGIMPWNFPVWQCLRFTIPTILAGNVCLHKPAPNMAQTAILLDHCFQQAHFKERVFQNLFIDESRVEDIVANGKIAGLALTGSENAGRAVGTLAGQYLKPCVLELGGMDAFMVLEGADIDRAAEEGVLSRFLNNGQSCIAAKRFIIEASIYPRFLTKFLERLERLKENMQINPDSAQPMVNKSALENLERQVALAKDLGGKVLYGGKGMDRDGYFFGPTLIEFSSQRLRQWKEEVFGPLAVIASAKDLKEAISLANDSPYGLGASVWCRDDLEAMAIGRQLDVGMVSINQLSASHWALPFGGVKNSGFGRELGEEGLRSFVNVKTYRYCE